MKRAEVLDLIIKLTDPARDALVLTNGRTVREALYLNDRANHFYMLSSMGHAPMIALGVAMAQPDRTLVVLDGDGNLLMNLGGLVHVASVAPKHFVHVVLDNQVYGTTGSQRCLSADTDLAAVAQAAGYKHVKHINTTLADVEAAFKTLYAAEGPSFLCVAITPEDLADTPVFDLSPETIKTRFRGFLQRGASTV